MLSPEITPFSSLAASEHNVEVLAGLVARHHKPADGKASALRCKLSSILDKSNPALLAAYMAFLKRVDAIHLLMFTMDVEVRSSHRLDCMGWGHSWILVHGDRRAAPCRWNMFFLQ